MQKIQLKTVSEPDEIVRVAELGKRIWREYYRPLLGDAQITYMLDKYQSERAVASQLDSGYTYWLIEQDGVPCGYCGFVRETDRLFLSKLYLLQQARGQGVGRAVFEQLRREADGMRAIYLTVNKQNRPSIAVYQKLGFREIDAVKTDIGGGFFMDDYIMELSLV